MVGRMFAGTTHKKCNHHLCHHHQDDGICIMRMGFGGWAECLWAILTKSAIIIIYIILAIIIFTIITRMMVRMLVGGQNVGLGSQPTTPKKTDSSSCSDQTSPPLPIVHSLCHCRPAICVFCIGIFVFYVRMCFHVFQIKPILSLSPYLLFLDGQRYCEKYSVLITI